MAEGQWNEIRRGRHQKIVRGKYWAFLKECDSSERTEFREEEVGDYWNWEVQCSDGDYGVLTLGSGTVYSQGRFSSKEEFARHCAVAILDLYVPEEL